MRELRLRHPPGARREELKLARDMGQAVHDRRAGLGISQVELGRRAGMTQPQISELELSGTVPTLPLLARLARALDTSLQLELVDDESNVAFRARTPAA
ncbi:helix-turn-helix domain-containing protein [Streptomyces sp. NBC_01180]|uniref:helix-turn-helix domain-containing protein n=1 Tax=Streptomyces sp. NBC_01180 TaxID=2903763 RepID=UPI003867362D|nr:helix-turn-helix transcriptional regulator [Streptomyces sp. NBC_01180]